MRRVALRRRGHLFIAAACETLKQCEKKGIAFKGHAQQHRRQHLQLVVGFLAVVAVSSLFGLFLV